MVPYWGLELAYAQIEKVRAPAVVIAKNLLPALTAMAAHASSVEPTYPVPYVKLLWQPT